MLFNAQASSEMPASVLPSGATRATRTNVLRGFLGGPIHELALGVKPCTRWFSTSALTHCLRCFDWKSTFGRRLCLAKHPILRVFFTCHITSIGCVPQVFEGEPPTEYSLFQAARSGLESVYRAHREATDSKRGQNSLSKPPPPPRS